MNDQPHRIAFRNSLPLATRVVLAEAHITAVSAVARTITVLPADLCMRPAGLSALDVCTLYTDIAGAAVCLTLADTLAPDHAEALAALRALPRTPVDRAHPDASGVVDRAFAQARDAVHELARLCREASTDKAWLARASYPAAADAVVTALHSLRHTRPDLTALQGVDRLAVLRTGLADGQPLEDSP